MERQQKHPLGAEHYNLFEEIGSGATATIYRAVCIPTQETVAIKVLDFEKEKSELSNIAQEAQTMILMDQPNLLKAHCSFVTDHYLWVAGNILMDSRGAVKLCDFGAYASLFDAGKRLHGRNTFTGTPCWMAPEVLEGKAYDFKADILSFGITALELALGHAPCTDHSERDKKFSKSFRKMIEKCLVKGPHKRSSAQELLKHPFFKKARSSEYLTRTLIKELPSLGDSAKESKIKEYMVIQKKLAEVERGELPRYRMSDWNFDVEAIKTQASQLPDSEEEVERLLPSLISSSC
ncbi:hypothetical protein MKX03_015749 [Papaver bracteatum]|nr:hypothetical protein MKX03_015749 [Papaver bracteatum]